jgi:hypothetical protein
MHKNIKVIDIAVNIANYPFFSISLSYYRKLTKSTDTSTIDEKFYYTKSTLLQVMMSIMQRKMRIGGTILLFALMFVTTHFACFAAEKTLQTQETIVGNHWDVRAYHTCLTGTPKTHLELARLCILQNKIGTNNDTIVSIRDWRTSLLTGLAATALATFGCYALVRRPELLVRCLPRVGSYIAGHQRLSGTALWAVCAALGSVTRYVGIQLFVGKLRSPYQGWAMKMLHHPPKLFLWCEGPVRVFEALSALKNNEKLTQELTSARAALESCVLSDCMVQKSIDPGTANTVAQKKIYYDKETLYLYISSTRGKRYNDRIGANTQLYWGLCGNNSNSPWQYICDGHYYLAPESNVEYRPGMAQCHSVILAEDCSNFNKATCRVFVRFTISPTSYYDHGSIVVLVPMRWRDVFAVGDKKHFNLSQEGNEHAKADNWVQPLAPHQGFFNNARDTLYLMTYNGCIDLDMDVLLYRTDRGVLWRKAGKDLYLLGGLSELLQRVKYREGYEGCDVIAHVENGNELDNDDLHIYVCKKVGESFDVVKKEFIEGDGKQVGAGTRVYKKIPRKQVFEFVSTVKTKEIE